MPPPVNQQLGERRAGLRKREKADETRQSKPILSFKYSYSSGGDDLSGDGGSGQASQKAEELASESKRNDASMCEVWTTLLVTVSSLVPNENSLSSCRLSFEELAVSSVLTISHRRSSLPAEVCFKRICGG